MLYSKPNLGMIWAILLLVATGAMLKVFGMGVIEMGAALILILFAFVLAADWFTHRLIQARLRVIEASQEDLQITRLLMAMPPSVLESLQESRIIRQHVLGWGEVKDEYIFPASMHDPNPQRFKAEDVAAIWRVCTPEGFAPVSTWGDETIRRQCAMALVNRFVGYGWMTPAAGNQPAKWIGSGYAKAERALWG